MSREVLWNQGKKEEKRLREENEELRREIEKMKKVLDELILGV